MCIQMRRSIYGRRFSGIPPDLRHLITRINIRQFSPQYDLSKILVLGDICFNLEYVKKHTCNKINIS